MTDFNHRTGARKEAGISEVAMPDRPSFDESRRISQADALSYIADMLYELKELGERTQSETLTGLLQLAAREASLRKNNLK
jgi:hypothetical protein